MAGSQQKTEKPTGKKIADARKRGSVAKSRDLSTALTCLGGGITIYWSINAILFHTEQLITELWGGGFQGALESNINRSLFIQVSSHFFFMTLPVLLVISVLAVAANFAQVRALLAWEGVKPNLSRLNPIVGLRNFCSLRSLLELVKSVIKLFVVGYVCYWVIENDTEIFFPLVRGEIIDIALITGNSAFKIIAYSSVVMLFVSLLDYSYQRWQHQKDLMMTKQEIKEEHRQLEGNPQIKSRIRSLQKALWRKRMMASVPKADLVITNPTHYAVALAYSSTMEAPKLLAKGRNLIAKRIIKVARKHQIPIIENPPLARALYQQVEVDQQIPFSLYRAVAKVLAYVYQQRRKQP